VKVTGSLGELPPHLVEGIRLFRSGQYFLAHETLEEYWAGAPEGERGFYQGLIQLATGFHHLERGNLAGARRQFAKALARVSGYPDCYLTVDVAGLRDFLEAVPGLLDAGAPVTPPELVAWAGR
jgi:predicted metal-dependent hydrolase